MKHYYAKHLTVTMSNIHCIMQKKTKVRQILRFLQRKYLAKQQQKKYNLPLVGMSVGRAPSSAHTMVSLWESPAMGISSALKSRKLAGGKHYSHGSFEKDF